MPAVCAADLRESLLAPIEVATRDAAGRQDAELAAEIAALAAAGPPDGPDAWLADPPWELQDEYLAVTQDRPAPRRAAPDGLPAFLQRVPLDARPARAGHDGVDHPQRPHIRDRPAA